MMRRKTNYIQVTPIPSFIPRQLAIDMLHSHDEVIKTNPLVLKFEEMAPPRDAPADEFYSKWYKIFQQIQFIPGIGKMGSGDISFRGVFHDMPWGLQTHTYAPMNIDMRNKWQICGNQPGEPVQAQELGIGAPPEGLYLREDIEIKCNVTMVSFVKKEMKAASKVMVDRMIKKAELLDAGVLHAMFEDGKLKTMSAADAAKRATLSPRPQSAGLYQNPLRSPTMPYGNPGSPGYPPSHHSAEAIPMELPGDFSYAQHPQASQSGHLQPPRYDRYSVSSNQSGTSPRQEAGTWENRSNASSRPTSYSSDGLRSPGYDPSTFTAELPAHQESEEQAPLSNYKNVEAGRHEQYQSYAPQDNNRKPDPTTQRWQEVKPDPKGSQRMIFP